MTKQKSELFIDSFNRLLQQLGTKLPSQILPFELQELKKYELTNRGNLHEYEISIPSNDFQINTEFSIGTRLNGLLCNQTLSNNIRRRIYVATMFHDLFEMMYKPFRDASPWNYVKFAPSNIFERYAQNENDITFYNYLRQPNVVGELSILSNELKHHIHDCFPNNSSATFNVQDQFITFRIVVSYYRLQDNQLPFPINFELTTEEKMDALYKKIYSLKRQLTNQSRQYEMSEQSFSRRIRRLNIGIRQKTEELEETKTNLVKKSNRDNQILLKKVKELYENQEHKEQCPVCYDKIESKNLYVPGCAHFLCHSCAEGCIHSTGRCPLCRELIVPIENDEEEDINESQQINVNIFDIRDRPRNIQHGPMTPPDSPPRTPIIN